MADDREKPVGSAAPRPLHEALDRRTQRRRARRKLRRRLKWAALIVIVTALIAGYSFATSDRQIERLAVAYLSDLFHAQVRIHSASFSFFHGVEVNDIRIEFDDPQRPIFLVERIDLVHNPLLLFRGQLQVQQIVARRPHINLEQQDGLWNFQSLFAGPPASPPTGPRQTPVIYVEQGDLNVRQLRQGQVVYEHHLNVSGVVQPAAGRPGVFTFFTSDLAAGGLQGNITRGQINTETGRVSFEGRAANVPLSEQVAENLPPEARQVWRKFEPQGSVSLKVSFDNQPTDRLMGGFRIEANLNAVALTYRHQQMQFTFRNMTGQALIDQDGLVLKDVHGRLSCVPLKTPDPAPAAATAQLPAPTIAGLLATPESLAAPDIAVVISGRVTDITPDREAIGYDLTLVAEDLDLARAQEMAVSLSRDAREFYRLFQPSGRAEVRLRLMRRSSPADSPMDFAGSVRFWNCRSVNGWFPYPVEEISGEALLAPNRVDIVRLQGRHEEARVSAVGYVKNFSHRPQVDLRIEARHLAFTPVVRKALGDSYPSFLTVYDSLHPQGLVNVTCRVLAPASPTEHGFTAITVIDLQDTQLLYDNFPYQLTEARGQIVIEGSQSRIENVTGRHGRARLAISGTIRDGVPVGPATPGGAVVKGTSINLKVLGQDVPLDADLGAALPAEQQKIYQSYHPSGLADIEVNVTGNTAAPGGLDHQALINLREARIVFEEFPYPIEGLSGRMEITRDKFLLRDLQGANAESAVTISGAVERRSGDYVMDLRLVGRNILLDRDLKGALSLHSARIWRDLQPEGRVDIDCRLKKEFGRPAAASNIVLDAKDLSLAYRHFPYPVRHARGRITFDGQTATIESLESDQPGGGRITLAGTVAMAESGAVASQFALRATGLRIDRDLQQSLPPEFAGAVAGLRMKGLLSVNLPQLTYQVDPAGQVTSTFTGTAVIDEGELDLGVPVDRLVAYISLGGRLAGGKLRLDGFADVPTGRIAGKEVTNLHALLSQPEGSGRLAISNLEGQCYDGKLQGEGEIVFARQPRYDLRVGLMDVNFERFLKEGMSLDAPVVGGLLDGEFIIHGRGTLAGGAEAGATFHVTQSRFYELPLVVQILNALRLRSDAATFSSADASFLYRNQGYAFDRLLLSGPSLSLHGAGRMEQDGRLNLVFTTGKGTSTGLLAALSELAEGVRRELLLVVVGGTIHDPQVKAESFMGLTAPLREFVKALQEGRRPQSPPPAGSAAPSAAGKAGSKGKTAGPAAATNSAGSRQP